MTKLLLLLLHDTTEFVNRSSTMSYILLRNVVENYLSHETLPFCTLIADVSLKLKVKLELLLDIKSWKKYSTNKNVIPHFYLWYRKQIQNRKDIQIEVQHAQYMCTCKQSGLNTYTTVVCITCNIVASTSAKISLSLEIFVQWPHQQH